MVLLLTLYWFIPNYSMCSQVKMYKNQTRWPASTRQIIIGLYFIFCSLRCLMVPISLSLLRLPDLRSLWAPLLYRSPGNISVWHQSPLPPKKVTHAWVSLPLHLLPAEVWGNFLQVVHGEGEEAQWLHCSLWYCQGRVMALCTNSHCRLTECDFGPVFLCITTTVSKKGMAKGLRARKGNRVDRKRQTPTCPPNTLVRFPQQASGRDNAAQDGRRETPKPESGSVRSIQDWGTLAGGTC